MIRNTTSPRLTNPSQAVLVVGLLLTLLVIMFRPAGADAVLPKTADVFLDWQAKGEAKAVTVSSLATQTSEYQVILKGKKNPTAASLTGVPLVTFLEAAGVDTTGLNFVRIRFGSDDDRMLTLQPLDLTSTDRPPIVLSEGRKPGVGPFATPQIVPGQPDLNKPIREVDFIRFDAKAKLTFIPGKAGAEILSVKVDAKKTKSGQYKLTASAKSSGKLSYEWFGFDSKGNAIKLGTGKTFTTTDATTGSQEHVINVVVSEENTGSMGQGSYTYNSKKQTSGTTKNPFPKTKPAPSPGGSGSGTPGGFPGSGSGGFQAPPATVIPRGSTTPPPAFTPQPPSTTPPPVAEQAVEDTTAITNIAQNFSGVGGLRMVSGVLLSAPTIAPVSASGGGILNALPAPVASELNTIFKPIEGAEDVWAYLLALLFAFSISGAVREWVNP